MPGPVVFTSLFFFSFSFSSLDCVCVGGCYLGVSAGVHAMAYMGKSEDNCQELSPSTMGCADCTWIELRSLDLWMRHF